VILNQPGCRGGPQPGVMRDRDAAPRRDALGIAGPRALKLSLCDCLTYVEADKARVVRNGREQHGVTSTHLSGIT